MRISSIWSALALASLAAGQALAQSHTALPPDVDAESLSRLPALTRDQLDPDGQAIYDRIVGDGPRPLTGPVAVTLHSPRVAEAFHLLNDHLRRHGELSPRYYEVAILVAAWEFEQQYEWSAHEPAALRFGAPQAVIDTIKYDREPAGLSAEDTLVIRFARSLLRDHELGSELYAEAVATFGEQGTLELATIIGDYVMAGIVLTAVDQHLPADRPPLLPPR